MTSIELHHLRRLTRPVAKAGPRARAIAVYSEPAPATTDQSVATQPARDQGFEGVACVDDAARAIVLYSGIWRRQRAPSARTAVCELLEFLAYMQDDDGRFSNFIVEWTGRRNRVGATSHPGGPAWQARAIHALACGVAITGDEEWDERFRRALPWLDHALPFLDVAAVAVLAMLEHWRATGAPTSAERAVSWSQDIARHTSESKLLNSPGVEPIHLWGHLQEAALADAGTLFDQPVLVECARASADALLLPAVDSAFDFERVLPFDVSCTVAGLSAVARATSDERYANAASLGRQWFYGRNTARQPMYDATRGLIYDGIDRGVVNRNSGAESNIEGALALLE